MLTELKSAEQRTSYALGIDVGASLGRLPISLDLEAFIQGFQDVTGNRTPLLDPESFQKTMQAFQEKMREESQKAQAGQGTQNQQAGKDFLAGNKVRPGVKTTTSGLQYEVLTAGTGATPSADDMVTVHYVGTLVDGTEFDSSVRRGEPAQFPVSGVIPGWSEGLQLMKVGGKYRLVVPSELAYGARGAGQAIGPHATLVFEVELLGIGQE